MISITQKPICYIMPYKNKEDRLKFSKDYYLKNKEKMKAENSLNYYENRKHKLEVCKKYRQKTGCDKNRTNISSWKYQGIISNDWDKTYQYYINCTHCEYCDKKFKNSKDRQLDHDHNINDDVNIRGILCRVCNTNDVFDGYFKQSLLN